MKKALVVGGANGIGLSIATELAHRQDIEKIIIVDKGEILEESMNPKFEYFRFDLSSEDYGIFDNFQDIDTLMITAGFGKLDLFRNVDERHIMSSFSVNTVSVLRIIRRFYDKLESASDFYCGVMVSIAGFMSSPFFSVYASTKAALKIFIESVNVELEKSGTTNRILNVSPGSLKGTSFSNGKTDLNILSPMALDIIKHLENKDDLYIPMYDEIYRHVLERYHDDFRAEGRNSYYYKIKSGRVKSEIK